jgi:multiple sugar transport system substrate-binding protein
MFGRKKLTISVLALTMATEIVLTGCNGDEETSTKSSAPKKVEVVKITFWDDNA